LNLSLPMFGSAGLPGGASKGMPRAAPASARAGRHQLKDSHGRVIRELRLSITDRCNFRCVYCMEPDVRFLDAGALLSVDELVRVARLCVALGVRKVRITGGEPTVHPRLVEIIRGVAGLGVADVALTTNGALMDSKRLAAWLDAGLSRITVSIDSLRPEVFAAVTRSRCSPDDVIAGVAAAKGAGFSVIKLNAVVVRGFNEGEVADLAGLARRFGVEVRFIEYMPLDSARAWDPSKLVPADEILERIGAMYRLVEVGREGASGTALLYGFADGAPGRIGVIAPVTRPFCGECSRLRITADGKVRPCLFSREEWDLMPLLRSGAGDDEVEEFLVDATWTKQAGHGISSAGFVQPDRPMSAIGG